MIELKTPGEIDAMRAAGRVVAHALAAVRAKAAVGTSLTELDEVARAVIAGAGATSSFLGYQPRFAPTPFPAVICASVNDVVLHGIPGPYRLRAGDLLSIDCGASVDGWHGDAATSFVVGRPDPRDVHLIDTAERALAAGIEAARPGVTMGELSRAVADVIRAEGYGIHADFGGHGIGRAMHEDPAVPNDGAPGRGPRLRTGLVIAIEPAVIAGGGDAYVIEPDGWSLRTADGSRGAHVEHTVAVTDDRPRVLTLA